MSASTITKSAIVPKPRRWAFRYSLRSLFVLCTLCAIVAAFVGRDVVKFRNEYQRSLEQAQLAEKLGFHVRWYRVFRPWAVRTFAPPEYARRADVENRSTTIAPPNSSAPLIFVHDKLPALSAFIRHPDTTALPLEYSDLTDDDLLLLPATSKVNFIHLDKTRIGPRGLEWCTRFENLEFLLIGDGPTSDASLAVAAKCQRLKSLYVFNAPITDDGLKHLRRLPQLSELSLSGCRRIGAPGIRHLLELQLVTLNLSFTTIGDDSIPALGEMKSLKTLDLKGTKISREQRPKLQPMLPNTRINWGRDD